MRAPTRSPRFVAALDPPDYVELRPVETGLVMLQGRIGGDGAPFNFGEATVTRAAVRIASGEIGFSYVLGRDHDKARLAALCDALWQSATTRDALEREVLAPIRARARKPNAPADAKRSPRAGSISSRSCAGRIEHAGARLFRSGPCEPGGVPHRHGGDGAARDASRSSTLRSRRRRRSASRPPRLR